MDNIKVFYCSICQFPEETLPNCQRVRSYVDEIIIVHNQQVIPQVKEEMDLIGVTLHYVDWKEDFSFKRTQYIRKSGEVAIQKDYDKSKLWMLISDSDEFPSISLLQGLKKIITKAELQKNTVITINAHDIFIKGRESNPFTFIPRPLEDIDKSEIISSNVPTYHKELLVKYNDRLQYTGKVHHSLSGTGLRHTSAPREYYYDHIKTREDLHPHGCRNWFIGGGGVNEFGEKWKILREITDTYNIDSWEKMDKLMKIGNLPHNILQFFVDHKDDNDTPQDSELRSFYSYYKILHPNELEGIIQNVRTVVTEKGIISPIAKSESKEIYYDPNWRSDGEVDKDTYNDKLGMFVDRPILDVKKEDINVFGKPQYKEQLKNNQKEYDSKMSQHIIDNIYISNWKDAKLMHEKGINEIFTVAIDSPFIGNHHYGLVDGPYPENEKLLNDAINDLINTRDKSDEDIIVHCVSGYSRSTSVIVGYMIKKGYTHSVEESLNCIRKIRPLANPVPELLRLLKNMENEKDKFISLLSEDEIKQFVIKTYEDILARIDPELNDPDGVRNYTNAIKEGRIKRENLAGIFRRSEEYRDKGLET